jgi:hypothetical protein
MTFFVFRKEMTKVGEREMEDGVEKIMGSLKREKIRYYNSI